MNPMPEDNKNPSEQTPDASMQIKDAANAEDLSAQKSEAATADAAGPDTSAADNAAADTPQAPAADDLFAIPANVNIYEKEGSGRKRKKPKKKRSKVGRVIAIVLVCVVLTVILLCATQLDPVRNAMEGVPVIGKLPAVADKIPFICDFDKAAEQAIIDYIASHPQAAQAQPIRDWIASHPHAEKAIMDKIISQTKVEHFKKPVLRSDEEIEATGLTVEDVLAYYDTLAWDFERLFWEDTLKRHGLDVDRDLSAQFERIDVLNDNFDEPTEDFPFYGMHPKGHEVHFFWLDESYNSFKNIYDINLYTTIVGDQKSNHAITDLGVYKDQFEPVAEMMGSKQFLLTSEQLINFVENTHTSQATRMGWYENTMVYEPFQITRETIENATQEQLYLLYDFAKSIRSINIDLKDPNVTDSAPGDVETQ